MTTAAATKMASANRRTRAEGRGATPQARRLACGFEENKGGPRNAFARRVARLRWLVVEAVSDDDVLAVVGQLVSRARAGNVAAIKLLLAYTVGKPAAAVDPDALDLAEWRLLQAGSTPMEQLVRVLRGLPPDLACDLARALWPCMAQQTLEPLRQELQEPAEVGAAESGYEEPSANGPNGEATEVVSPRPEDESVLKAWLGVRPSTNGSDGEMRAEMAAAGDHGTEFRPPECT